MAKQHYYIYSFIHLADAFIQSNVYCIQDIVFINAFLSAVPYCLSYGMSI